MSKREGLVRSLGTVSFFTFLSRILGLLRDMAFAQVFGSGLVADAFFVAFRIPNLLRKLFAEGSLTVAFVPVFSDYLVNRGRERAFGLARTVLSLLIVILSFVTLVGILLSPWIVTVTAYGFRVSPEKFQLTVLLTRVMFPYILLISVVAFYMGLLNSFGHFGAPAAAPVFLNVMMIISIYWISPLFKEPIIGVAVGVLLGGILQVLLQVPFSLSC
ncbi:MAG: lipid II flippase MurJ, partial [Desulfatiglandales bacterium]